jgi:hypothetical protein
MGTGVLDEKKRPGGNEAPRRAQRHERRLVFDGWLEQPKGGGCGWSLPIRVSTGKQGESSLGIEAQREAIARFGAAGGLDVLTEFVEVENGKGSDALDRRPRLAEALAKPKGRRCPWWPSCAACPAT